jgi:hypothetical protein
VSVTIDTPDPIDSVDNTGATGDVEEDDASVAVGVDTD